jgi:exosome complex RNA-binding protein Rrp42 (RNase PH superfamily)
MDLELPLVAVPPPEELDGDSKSSSEIPKVDLLGGLWKLTSDKMSAICVSVGVFNSNSVILVDMDRTEEYLAKSNNNCLITVSVNDRGEICGVHKWGIGTIDPFIIRDVVASGIKVGQDISRLMTQLGSNTA